MAFKNVTPMALATGAVRGWWNSLFVGDDTTRSKQSVAVVPVTKKEVLSHMNPSSRFDAERVLDSNVDTFKWVAESNKLLVQTGLRAVALFNLPGQALLLYTRATKICSSFGKENHFEACEQDVRKWISQEVARK